jgi:hypothetical protein
MNELLKPNGSHALELRPHLLPYATKSRLPQHQVLIRPHLGCRPARQAGGGQMHIVACRAWPPP